MPEQNPSQTSPPMPTILVDVLGEAQRLPRAEREAFVRAKCTDPAMLSEALSLLQAMNRAGGFLGRPTLSDELQAGLVDDSLAPGATIGRYTLVEKIGEGAFGVVWAADQTEPLQRRVAIKIIKAGMDSRAVIARFEHERQTLALMQHPGIAQVYDAGTTPTGRPYFVLEFFQGTPLTRFCDEHTLSVRERLALLVQVCEAVQHAHAKGIIHRDLKPANILVVRDNPGAPARPVVIDFGVAKAIAARAAEAATLTEVGVLVGTPEYMSPEQADMAESLIDTRTDVYALGVVLYELLTGTLPFDARSLREAGYEAIRRVIRETDPPRPSARLSMLGTESVRVAQTRRMEIAELTASLRNELEWIPLRAMRKSRDERYRSAAELADDVGNYLAHRPLIAGPESAVYRARKLMRRNRAWTAAGAVMLAALATGAVGLAVGYARATSAEARARQERDRAEKVRDFLSETFRGVSPQVARGRDTALLGALMDKASARITSGELQNAPDAEGELRSVIAGVYQDMGRFNDAVKLADGIDESMLPSATARARLHALRGSLALDTSDLPAAGEHLSRALVLLDAPGADDPTTRVQVLTSLGTAASLANNNVEAGRRYEQALALARAMMPTNADVLAPCLTMMARNCRLREDFPRAQALYGEAIALLDTPALRDSPSLVTALNDRAILLGQQQQPDAALADVTKALALARAIYPDPHPVLASTESALGDQLMHAGRFKEATQQFESALVMKRRVYGDVSLPVMSSLHMLASIHIMSRDYERALAEATEADGTASKVLPQAGWDADTGWSTIATCLRSLGRAGEAADICDKGLERNRRVAAPDSVEYLKCLSSAAACFYEAGQLAKSNDAMRSIIRTHMQQRPDNPVPWIADAQAFYGANLLESGNVQDAEEAESVLRASVAARVTKYGETHWFTAMTRVALGRAIIVQACDGLAHAGNSQEAASKQAACIARLREAEGLVEPNVPPLVENIASLVPIRARRSRVLGAAQSMINMYEAWDKVKPGTGKAEKAAAWRVKLSEYDRAIP